MPLARAASAIGVDAGPVGVELIALYGCDLAICRRNDYRYGTGPRQIAEAARAKGMTVSPTGTTVSSKMTANKKLITPEDYKGLKFRVQSSKVLEASSARSARSRK